MQKRKFSLKQQLNSFKHAFNGLIFLVRNEHNSRIHLTIASLVVILSFYFKINAMEWIAVVFSIGFVFSAELINTSVEKLADFVCKEKNDNIKIIKDLAAAYVFVSALTAFIIGVVVFVPKIVA